MTKHKNKSRGMVVVPYVHSFTEKIQRIFAKHKVATVVKPQTTLRRVLLHPKDKIYKLKKGGVVYKIPCKQCEEVYVGETGRQFGVRLTEHRKEEEKTGNRNFTRSTSRSSAIEYHKSAITDHVCQNNHVMDWEAGEIIERESDKIQNKIRTRNVIKMWKIKIMNNCHFKRIKYCLDNGLEIFSASLVMAVFYFTIS